MRVRQVLRVDAGLYYGGGEVQAERTRSALADKGVDVRVFGPLDDDLGDLVHFFGLFDSHWQIAEHCLARGIPYVVSPIFATPRTTGRLRWRSFRQRHIDFQYPKDQARLLRKARAVFPLTQREEQNLTAFFGPMPGVALIPNGVDDQFRPGYSDREGVLHVGAFDRNKNQLSLIQALKGTGIRLRLIGRPHDQDYFANCRQEADPTVEFLEPVAHAETIQLYQRAKVFCLPSRHEILPLSAMEATACGCRVVLGNRWGGTEIWGDRAIWVDPDDVSGIRKAAEDALALGSDADFADEFRMRYSWSAVAENLIARYHEALA